MREHLQMDKLDDEIEAMEKAILGTTEESTLEKEEEVKAEEESKDPVESKEEALSQEAIEVKAEEEKAEPKKQRNDWKGRYTSLRGHHDALVFELRNEIGYLKDQVVALNKQAIKQEPNAPKPVDFTDTLSQSEKDVLGEEAVAALAKMTQKATESAVAPLKERLEMERQQRIDREVKESKDHKVRAQQIFIQRLGQLVPDYHEIDMNPKFKTWMNEQDRYSGLPRKDLFRRAETTGDVARVAEFFVQYKNMTAPPQKKDPLAGKVTPTGEGSGDAANQDESKGEIITMAMVNKFYSELAKGKYKGKQKLVDQTEADIEKAYIEGRLR